MRMRLLNADGSDGEVSGNGVRCLAAFADLAPRRPAPARRHDTSWARGRSRWRTWPDVSAWPPTWGPRGCAATSSRSPWTDPRDFGDRLAAESGAGVRDGDGHVAGQPALRALLRAGDWTTRCLARLGHLLRTIRSSQPTLNRRVRDGEDALSCRRAVLGALAAELHRASGTGARPSAVRVACSRGPRGLARASRLRRRPARHRLARGRRQRPAGGRGARLLFEGTWKAAGGREAAALALAVLGLSRPQPGGGRRRGRQGRAPAGRRAAARPSHPRWCASERRAHRGGRARWRAAAGARSSTWAARPLMPGLIDLHTHLTRPAGRALGSRPSPPPPRPGRAVGARNARVDAARPASPPAATWGRPGAYVDVDLRNAIERGRGARPASHCVAGNYVSSITGGAGDARQFSIYVDVPTVAQPGGRAGRDREGHRARTSSTRADFVEAAGDRRGPLKSIRPARSSTRTPEIQARGR